MQLIKKLSSKSIIGKVKNIAAAEFYLNNDMDQINPEGKSELSLYTIYGVCSGTRHGNTDNGDWISFDGEFKAIRDHDGEVFRAPRSFLMEPASSMLCTAMENADTVEIAFNVSIVPADNSYGYEYRCTPLLEIQETDTISALERKIQLRLKAPVKSEKRDKSKK